MKPPFMKNRKTSAGENPKITGIQKENIYTSVDRKIVKTTLLYIKILQVKSLDHYFFFILEYWLYIDIGAKRAKELTKWAQISDVLPNDTTSKCVLHNQQ